jgi:hypothetical protein
MSLHISEHRMSFLVFGFAISVWTWVVADGSKTHHDAIVLAGQNAPSSPVNVKSVVRVQTDQAKSAYSIAYEYDFPNRSVVYIEHLGEVPAQGHFAYISPDQQLEFRDLTDGKVLATVPLHETMFLAAKPPLIEIPDERSFPEAQQTLRWDSRSSLHQRANDVLAQYFYYRPRTDKGVVHVTTNFTPLSLVDVRQGVVAKMALLLQFPDAPKTQSHEFTVQSLVLEGRSHSDEFRPTTNPTVKAAADKFVARLISEIKSPQGTQP